jgi:glycosyltransferase involved in cell wall biosynthesis
MVGLASSYSGKEQLIFLCVGGGGESREIGRCKMVFTGYISDQTSMAECYQMADFYLHPSKMDSFPNVVLEAMACGVPSVASSVGGIPEQIRDGWNGYLSRPADILDMTQKCLSILENPDLRGEMGRNGLSLVREKFTLDRQVETYLKFYLEASEDFRIVAGRAQSPFRASVDLSFPK